MKLFAAFAFCLLASCQLAPRAMMPEPERTQCVADGGRVIAPQNREICLAPFSDAGQSCLSTAQCQGTCQSLDGGATGQCMALPIIDTCGLEYFDEDGVLQFGVCI